MTGAMAQFCHTAPECDIKNSKIVFICVWKSFVLKDEKMTQDAVRKVHVVGVDSYPCFAPGGEIRRETLILGALSHNILEYTRPRDTWD
jgi:hypothetical protein